jgi:hypothetical protein
MDDLTCIRVHKLGDCSVPWMLLMLIALTNLGLTTQSISAQASFAQTSSPSTAQVSTNAALYAFLRAAAADEISEKADRDRSAALIRDIGLSAADESVVTSAFVQYARTLRALHSQDEYVSSGPDSALQIGEFRAYDSVVKKLRTEMSPAGLQKFRAFLQLKKAKMTMQVAPQGATK